MVVHICRPSYAGGIGRRYWGPRPAWVMRPGVQTPILPRRKRLSWVHPLVQNAGREHYVNAAQICLSHLCLFISFELCITLFFVTITKYQIWVLTMKSGLISSQFWRLKIHYWVLHLFYLTATSKYGGWHHREPVTKSQWWDRSRSDWPARLVLSTKTRSQDQ
jgi:hypothetical protein